jgi:Ca2+-transporting ATPase
MNPLPTARWRCATTERTNAEVAPAEVKPAETAKAGTPSAAPARPTGLTDAQASDRLATDGPNELPVSRPRSMLRLLGDVVSEPMFLLLVACGGIYLLLG